jgi:hypothetical protein
MMMAFSVGSMSEAAAEARAYMYEVALSDVPPWAINAAIERWAKGAVSELGMGTLNFAFSPAPAILRRICMLELHPYQDQALKLTRLMKSISTERALDNSPIAPEVKSDSGHVVRITIQRM